MNELAVIENLAATAIYRLRQDTLGAGEPFMINVEGLPKNHCYLEYPNGCIELVAFDHHTNEFLPVKALTSNEILQLKKQLGL